MTVYSRKSFDPEHLLARWPARGNFTSLVPTHYIMMLALPAAVTARHDVARRQADDLVGPGAARHQAGDHGDIQELRPL